MVLAAGEPAPGVLARARRRRRALHAHRPRGRPRVLVFYPFAFSPVCTDQLSVYNELLEDFAARGATLYGVSCDAIWSQQAFKEQLGDRHRAALGLRAQGRRLPRLRRAARARDARSARSSSSAPTRVVRWSYQAPPPGDLPGRQPDLRRARSLSDLRPHRCRPPAPRITSAGPDGAPLVDRLRRLRVPVLRGRRPPAARARAARRLPALPGPRQATRAPCRPPAPPRPRPSRARSGRCTTRCSPTRAGSRTRTCGRAPSGSGSTSSASTPTGGPSASRARRASSSAAACAPGWRPRPPLFVDGKRFSGRRRSTRRSVRIDSAPNPATLATYTR